MVKSRASWPTFRYEPPKIVVSDWKLPPISKMKVSGAYFCAFCRRKLHRIGLPAARHPKDQRVGDLAVMQVQKVRRAVVGFEHGQVLRAEMGVRLLARKDREQKRQVGVVRVQQIQLAEVERVVAGHGGEVGVELVVGLRKQAAVGVGEDASELGPELLQFGF